MKTSEPVTVAGTAVTDTTIPKTTSDTFTWSAFEVRQLRYRLGWSRAEMARCLKLTPDMVCAWETGRFQPSEEHCSTLLAVLNQAESNAEKVQRRPIAEVVMRDRGLSQIHDLEVIDVMTGKA